MTYSKLEIEIPGAEYATVKFPEAIASYRINNCTISVYKKEDIPNRFVRFMQKLILGIEWKIL